MFRSSVILCGRLGVKFQESIQKYGSVQLSPFTDWVVGGTWRTIQLRSSSSLFCRRPVRAVLAWAGMSTLIVHPAFPLPTTSALTLQGALKDGFGKDVAYDMLKPCKVPSLGSFHMRFLWNHKEVDLAPYNISIRNQLFCHCP